MFTEGEVQALKPGQLIHADETCEVFRITSVKPAKKVQVHPHFEAWALSPSGVILVRITCNSQPGFHRASDHERLPKAAARVRGRRPPIKHRAKRAKRAA